MGPGTPIADMQAEIAGGKNFVVDKCGVPAADVTGYRSTYLVTNPEVRQVISENGFQYDSSIEFTQNDGLPGARSWPFTMDYGVPKDGCDKKYQVCNPSEKYPGLWQVPIWDLVYDGQVFTMDPGVASPGNGKARNSYDVLKSAFDDAYSGNRAPVPIYVHAAWFTPTTIKETQQFISYALTKPDTYFVTMQQLIDWMKAPVPKDEMPAWLQQRCGGDNKAVDAVPPAPSQGNTTPDVLSWEKKDTDFRFAIFGRRLRGLRAAAV